MVAVKLSTSFHSQESWLRQKWSHYLCITEELLHMGTISYDHECHKQKIQTKYRPLFKAPKIKNLETTTAHRRHNKYTAVYSKMEY